VKWRVFFGSAAGTYHLNAGEPCQDAGHHAVVDGAVIGVVCDGAGSASQGHAGANFMASELVGLIGAAVESRTFAWGDPAEFLVGAIDGARTQLSELALARDLLLRDFASTLVGCVCGPRGGCLFHIGDGFGVALDRDGGTRLSPPENGEYSDQTYFVTDEGWKDHLRVTRLAGAEGIGLIGLMSDGAATFAINRERSGFYRPFLDPVASYLAGVTDQDGNFALQNLLESARSASITPDDRTLLLAIAA
jgi:hypothetical protein